MELAEILRWIDRRLAEKKMSASRASILAVGHPDAIRNMRRGFGKPKIETLRRLADVLGDPPPGLFYGSTTPTNALPSLEDLEADLEQAERTVEHLKITIETLKARQAKTG